MSESERLGELEQRLGYRFRDRELLATALVHASLAAEQGGGGAPAPGAGRGNERLEYLGDAVVGLAVAHLLYAAHPGWNEGELSRARAALVNRKALAGCARGLELGRFVRLGRTEVLSGGEKKDRVLANAFEAVVGAVYLDGGIEAALELARATLGDAIRRGPERDAKSELNELCHARFATTPRYTTVGDSGVEDDDERFTVEVRVADRGVWGRGVGRSKQRAEQAAAAEALRRSDDG